MKILVLIGSPRQKDSYQICEEIRDIIQKQMDTEVAFEYVRLNKLSVGECKGCEQCLLKGEQYCPMQDDSSDLVKRMIASDGIIFSSPVYACQVTASFKKIVDRLSYLFHRPELIGKPALTVVTSAGGGIRPTAKYLKLVACGWGCYLAGQINIISTRYFAGRWGVKQEDSAYREKNQQKIKKSVTQFVEALNEGKSGIKHRPTVYEVYMFHGLRSKAYTSSADYAFWKQNGWLDGKYYYETKMSLGSYLTGKIMDAIVRQMVKRMGLEGDNIR